MKKTFYLLISIFIVSCHVQNTEFEDKTMACIYNSFPDEGAAFKKTMTDYEDLLIYEGILKDNSPAGYKALLEEIKNNNQLNKRPSVSIFDQLMKIKNGDMEQIKTCNNILQDTGKYNTSKAKIIDEILKKLNQSTNVQPSGIAEVYIEHLSNTDYKNNYYKLRIFLLISVYLEPDIIERNLSEGNKLMEDENNFVVQLDSLSRINVDNRIINKQTLKKKINEYAKEKESRAIFVVKSERKTEYIKYIEVVDIIDTEIENIRAAYAKKQYKKELKDLTEEEKEEVESRYPRNFNF